jgi:GT2 family glycosyltransferase
VTSRVTLVTTVAGRHDHLLRQRAGLRSGVRAPDEHVIVAMGDPDIRGLVKNEDGCVVLEMDAATPLPLGRARNLGAAEARRHGADVLVFLDVDCIPSAQLIDRYAALAETAEHGGGLLCGQVSYLPPGFTDHGNADALEQNGVPHPARPVPRRHDVVRTVDYDLFWSLSFAIRTSAWQRVGGFCEAYTGYGGEDTDFGQCARVAGLPMHWVGGATAYHQHHRVSDPPIEHLDDILRNAQTFAGRWGRWPMLGWLEAFESRGLVVFDRAAGTWRRAAAERTQPGGQLSI